MLDKILNVLEHFRKAEEWIDTRMACVPKTRTVPSSGGRIVITSPQPPWFSYSRFSVQALQAGLDLRYREYPLNKELLYGACPKKHEFEIELEPTVFVKVSSQYEDFIKPKYTEDVYSQVRHRRELKDKLSKQIILYTDPYNML